MKAGLIIIRVLELHVDFFLKKNLIMISNHDFLHFLLPSSDEATDPLRTLDMLFIAKF